MPVSSNPSGSFEVPDTVIAKATPVAVDVAATGIPPGTVVVLHVFPDSPEDLRTVYLPTAQTTLEGTRESTTGVIEFTFPYGFSRAQVTASWER